MRLVLQSQGITEIAADWLVVGVCEKEALTGAALDLDAKVGGMLSRLRERGDIAGKCRELTPLYQPAGIGAQRLLIVGLGPRDKADYAAILGAAAAAAKMISSKPTKTVAVAPLDVRLGAEATLRAWVAGFFQGASTSGLRKSTIERTPPEELQIVAPKNAEIEESLRRAEVEGRATNLARELVNLPPCDLFPETFAERAREVAVRTGLELEILDEQQLLVERMNALLAVARGSERPPRLVILRHRAGGDKPALALVGKGVTFDSGGLSLKTTEQWWT
jgi:leucyl aminopeptidase